MPLQILFELACDPRAFKKVYYVVRIRRIIFDLDGTLIDSAQLTAAIVDRMLADRGAVTRADRALIRRMDALGGEAMIAAALGEWSQDPAREIEEFRTIHRTIDIPADLPFAGVPEVLADLRDAGIAMAICSNKPQFLCEKILGELGLARHFAAIVGSAPGRARKPDPESATIALASLAGTRENTLFCGDSVIDLATARGAGLTAALVAWGYGTAEALAQDPDAPLVRSMQALRDGVLGHGNLAFPHR